MEVAARNLPYRKLINRLFENPSVRYAVVIDNFGYRCAGGMKPGVSSITPDSIVKRFEMQAVLIMKMVEGYEPYVGKLLWSTVRWENVTALFFLLGHDNGILSLTLRSGTPNEVVDQIHKLVQEWCREHL